MHLPRVFRKLCSFIFERSQKESLLGDFEELYLEKRQSRGALRANAWCLVQIVRSVFPLVVDFLQITVSLTKNFTRVAFRNLRKNKGYSLINILGLAVGLSVTYLIVLFIHDELTYDTHHEKADQIYRVSIYSKTETSERHWARTVTPFGPTIKEEYPEVLNYVTIQDAWAINGSLRYKNDLMSVTDVFYANPTIFDVFDYEFISGSPENALNEPHTIVLTESFAKRVFKDEDPMGKILTFNRENVLTVTGVLKDIPKNSHFTFNALVSLETYYATRDEEARINEWRWATSWVYLLLPRDYNKAELEAKYGEFYEKHIRINRSGNSAVTSELVLQPLKDIHLHSNIAYELKPGGNYTYIVMFGIVAMLILAIASANYINLSTARLINRAKEAGIRKVLGSFKYQLAAQFLIESIIIALVSLLISSGIIKLLLPTINNIAGKDLVFAFGTNVGINMAFFVLAVVIGIVGGIYPAIHLSIVKPAKVLKGKLGEKAKGVSLRKSLVVFQFALSLFLIVSTMTIKNQMAFLKEQNLGFDKERVVVLHNNVSNFENEVETIVKELQNLESIEYAAVTSSIPGSFTFENSVRYESDDGFKIQTVQTLFVTHDFLKSLNLNLAAGRDFSEDNVSDKTSAFIINQAAAQQWGWTEPLTKQIKFGRRPDGGFRYDGSVVGVVENFHVNSLRESIEPMVLMIQQNSWGNLIVRTKSNDLSGTLNDLQGVWEKVLPDYPFEYYFLDAHFDAQYKFEGTVLTVFSLFTFLALFISLLGLSGLTAYIIQQRTKEIGVRKVLGASAFNVISLIAKEYVKLMIVSFFVIVPLAYYALQMWLTTFAYRIDLEAGYFLMLGGFVLFIALLAVSFQTMKAALQNPVTALRYE